MEHWSYVDSTVMKRSAEEFKERKNAKCLSQLSRFSLDLSLSHVYKIVFLCMMTNAQLQSFISVPYVSANELYIMLCFVRMTKNRHKDVISM